MKQETGGPSVLFRVWREVSLKVNRWRRSPEMHVLLLANRRSYRG